MSEDEYQHFVNSHRRVPPQYRNQYHEQPWHNHYNTEIPMGPHNSRRNGNQPAGHFHSHVHDRHSRPDWNHAQHYKPGHRVDPDPFRPESSRPPTHEAPTTSFPQQSSSEYGAEPQDPNSGPSLRSYHPRTNTSGTYRTGPSRRDPNSTTLGDDFTTAAILQKLSEMQLEWRSSVTNLWEEIDSVRQDIEDVASSRPSTSAPETRKKRGKSKKSPFFKVPHVPTPRSVDRNQFMMLFRKAMNEYLTINHDRDIIGVYSIEDLRVTEEDVSNFDQGGPAPRIDDDFMPIYWDNVRCLWNHELCAQMTARFIARYPQYNTEEGRKNAQDHFWQRLGTLSDIIQRYQPRDGETEEDAYQRCQIKEDDTRRNMRQRTRRDELWKKRYDVAWEMAADEEQEQNENWIMIAEMIEKIGADGMSSDESEDEDSGPNGTVATVRSMPWRSPEVTRSLRRTDDHANRKSAYGNQAPGNKPHVRRRFRHAQPSRRAAVSNLPLNFYDPQWLRDLPDVLYMDLAPEAEAELPTWDEDY
ncbi:hypothetical protein VNI00_002503 [Paramarasmius palmivorus]|uniref:Uncharacterized protein n=1 Tax=Paramarasmius palmivorus TaxID=297713 RepID=A0AAW0DVT4_9AGAR